MNLEFRKPNYNDVEEIMKFKNEFQENNSGMDGTGILFKSNAEEWLEYNKEMERRDNPNSIPCLQYGLFDKDENRLLGLIQVRLELKGYLVEFGGHIGYCVRPAERRKGYAKEMLRQALAISKKEGLTKVMVTCLEDNIGSAKTIEACDGIYEKTVFDDLNYKANLKRYWITI